MRHFDSLKFLEDLNTQSWQLLSFFENPNDALDFFMQLFESLLPKHAPKITKRVKRTLQLNWFNTEISEASKMRDYYHRIHDMQNYRIWRNKTNTLISNSKQQYFTKNINENKRNPIQLRKTLHDLTNESKKQHAPTIVSQEGEHVLGPEETANSFNDFFTSVFQQYSSADNIEADCISNKLKDFIKTKLPQEARFQTSQISLAFVKKQLQSHDITKATGLDGLSARFLRLSAEMIAAPLTKIFNLSISTGIFPESFKKAKVTPCFKKIDISDRSNY